MYKKKGQSALEFLTTYGWAFLVILIMIGALSYFGVLNPSRFLPDKCIFGSGIGGCSDSAMVGNNILFKVYNNFGKDITLSTTGTTVSVTGTTTPCAVNPALANRLNVSINGGAFANSINAVVWPSGAQAEFAFNCTSVSVGERPTAKITLAYTMVGSSYPKTVDGEISVKRN